MKHPQDHVRHEQQYFYMENPQKGKNNSEV
jgi:hypothetical protein